MTKKFHVCDDKCEPEGTGIHNVKSNVKKNTRKQYYIYYGVDKIGNELETNKVLEKTLITLRKLQQDIAN